MQTYTNELLAFCGWFFTFLLPAVFVMLVTFGVMALIGFAVFIWLDGLTSDRDQSDGRAAKSNTRY